MQPRSTLLTVLLISGTVTASAQSAHLDSSFNGHGRHTIAFRGTMDQGAGVAMTRDAKMVVAGSSYDTKWDFAVTRLRPNGSIDSTFGTNGMVTTNLGGTADHVTAVAVDTAGKAVVAGFSVGPGRDLYALARYLPDGTPDSSFDGDGQLTSLGLVEGRARAVAVQLDGTITVCGSAVKGSGFNFGLVRYKSTGVPETSFGNGGLVTTAVPGNGSQASALVIQPDGKIVVAGYVSSAGWDFAVVRYKIDGSVDSAFGVNGIVVTDMGSAEDMATSVVLQPDGKIIVAGNVKFSVNGMAMARYLADGQLDTSFGTGGRVLPLPGSPNSFVNTALLQSTGRIVLAGHADSAGVSHFALARYLEDGNIDQQFIPGGQVRTVIGTSFSYIMGATLQVDDKVVAAGWSWNGSDNEFAVARYGAVPPPVVSVPRVPGGPAAVRAYPNPVGEQVTLSYTLGKPSPVSIRLTDAAGRVLKIYEQGIPQAAGRHEQELALPGGLPGGMYFLILSTPEGNTGVRLLK